MSGPPRDPYSPPQTLRLFFALWPDAATRAALDQVAEALQREWGGRRMRADTLHLTLAFLGDTPADLLDPLSAAADALHADPIRLVLDHAGHWRHNRVGWLGPSQPVAPLAALVAAVADAVQAAGAAYDPRPHVPHVTLLRNTAGGALPGISPVVWTAREFALVASRPDSAGAHYDVIRRWPLSGRAA